jgi:predicted glycogen debranching enzyme
MISSLPSLDSEWLESDGLGGFSSGTVGGVRTRRYHAILLPATQPPAGRMVLVNGFDAELEIGSERVAISAQQYGRDTTAPRGFDRLEIFSPEPWPQWRYRILDGLRIEQEIFAVHHHAAVALAWRLAGAATQAMAKLRVRLFLSGRDFHALHHQNDAFQFTASTVGDWVTWAPYAGVPQIVARTNASYRHDPAWYRNFFYQQEFERGLDCLEELASPGVFEWDLRGAGDLAVLLLGIGSERSFIEGETDARTRFGVLRQIESERRNAFPTALHRAADAYLVRRGQGRTIIAGFPWFGDWGRDTFIALRGLCMTGGRLQDARMILAEWAGAVSEGMLPNRFPDSGTQPEYNSVDASLWYIIAVHEYLQAVNAEARDRLRGPESDMLHAVSEILCGYAHGTRFGIRMDEDGLLQAGVPGVQLTWMDAKVGDWVVTPRIGKPVEVQALWVNALAIGAQLLDGWHAYYEAAIASFTEKAWNESAGCLFDVIDDHHVPDQHDGAIRPNQIFAVGGLPLAIVDGDRAWKIVETVERQLLTPLGLRSLAPGQHGYTPRYEGGVLQRDGSYHQGTVWPWLMGAFVDAWLRVRRHAPDAKAEARDRFVKPLEAHLQTAGLGHVSEIADADVPHTPRGCPFQAWSVAELLRLQRMTA